MACIHRTWRDAIVSYLRWGSLPALCYAEGADSGPGSYCVRQHWLSGSSVWGYFVWGRPSTGVWRLAAADWPGCSGCRGNWRSCRWLCGVAGGGVAGRWGSGGRRRPGWGAAGRGRDCSPGRGAPGTRGSGPGPTAPSRSGRPKPCGWRRKGRSPGRRPAVYWTSRSRTPPASLWRKTLVLCLPGESTDQLEKLLRETLCPQTAVRFLRLRSNLIGWCRATF